LLNQALPGLNLPENGVYDEATTQAVKMLQARAGLVGGDGTPDGKVGPKTMAALDGMATAAPNQELPKPALSTPATPTLDAQIADGKILEKGGKPPDAVRELKELLNAQNPGLRLEEDGGFGEQTKAAVKMFQAQHGLKVDGKVGPLTLEALKNAARDNV